MSTPRFSCSSLWMLLLLASCQGASLVSTTDAPATDDPATGAPPTSECQDVPAHTLDEVFTASLASEQPTGCTAAGCHGSGAGGLTFTSASELWEAAVDQPSSSAPGRMLVRPGQPSASELYLRLLPDASGQMPVGGPFLDDAALRALAGWICAGAPRPAPSSPPPPPDAGPAAPHLTTVAPDSVQAGTGAVTLVLRGGGFMPDSEVELDGAALSATFVDEAELQVSLDAALTAMGGVHRVSVLVPGASTTEEQLFTVAWPAPHLVQLVPEEVPTNGAPLTLHVRGAGFTEVSWVVLDGAPSTTHFVDATELTVEVPTFATPGTLPVFVETPAPGGGLSESFALQVVTTQLPTLTGLSPGTAPAASPFSLTVTGSGYVCTGVGARVLLGGSALTPSSCESTRLVVSVPSTSAGDYPVQVRNPSGDVSNALTLAVVATNPRPTLTSLSPSGAAAGGTAFTLAATGTDFVAGATLQFDGRARTTTVVSSTRVEATVLATDIATAGTYPITVVNPGPGGGTSAALSFSVQALNPRPSVSALAPCGTVAGSGPLVVTVSGTGFVPESTVTLSGTALAVAFVSASELRATVPASLLGTAPAGNAASVVVSNPSPGGGSAAPVVFGVASRVSTLSGHVQPIFTAQCASCHRSGSNTSPALEAGASYDALVGVPCTGCKPRLLVRACDPTRTGSELLDKVLATSQSPACSGSPMPKGAPLSAAERQTLVDWVAQGAPR